MSKSPQGFSHTRPARKSPELEVEAKPTIPVLHPKPIPTPPPSPIKTRRVRAVQQLSSTSSSSSRSLPVAKKHKSTHRSKDAEGFLPRLSRMFEDHSNGQPLRSKSHHSSRLAKDRVTSSAHRVSPASTGSTGRHRRHAHISSHIQTPGRTSPSVVSVMDVGNTSSSGMNYVTLDAHLPAFVNVPHATRQVPVEQPNEKGSWCDERERPVDVFSYLDDGPSEFHYDARSESSSSENGSSEEMSDDGRSPLTSPCSTTSDPTMPKHMPQWTDPQQVQSDFESPIREAGCSAWPDHILHGPPIADSEPQTRSEAGQVYIHRASQEQTPMRPVPTIYKQQAATNHFHTERAVGSAHPLAEPSTREFQAPQSLDSSRVRMSNSCGSPAFTKQTAVEEEDDNAAPRYRSFKYLQHKILLRLQDELTYLEEQLRSLNALVADQSFGVGENTLHFRRTNLLREIHGKLNQYNGFLASYKACNHFPAGSEEELTTYDRWLLNHSPIARRGTRFLKRVADLFYVSEPIDTQYAILLQRGILGFPITFLFTIVIFGIVQNALGRVCFAALLLGGICAAIWWTGQDVRMVNRDVLALAGLYAGALAVLAVTL